MDAGWEDWDLKVTASPVCGARILIASENHGADKRLLRVRAALRLSRLSWVVIGGLAALTLASLILGKMSAATVLAVLVVVSGGAAVWQLARFARRLHGMIEDAAAESALVPVAPLARSLPVGSPRTA